MKIRKSTLISVIIIAVAGIAPYINSLRNPFIWDEEVMVVTNPIIQDWKYFPFLFKTGIFGGPVGPGGFYRPIYMLTFILDYHIWKLNVHGYHIFNILLHIINSLLLYRLILKLGLNIRIAWFASIIFALLPVNCQAVTYIAGRIELILSFMLLLCILCFLKGVSRSWLFFIPSNIFYTLAILTKESSLIFPFVILAFSFIFIEKKERRIIAIPLIALFAITFGYIGFRFFLIGSPLHRTLSLINEASILERIYTLPRILLTYIQLSVAPIILKSEYHFVIRSFKDPHVWLGTPFLTLFFIMVIGFLKPKKHSVFFSSWFLLGILPYANIIIPLHATLMEHWAYFSSMAFAVLVSMAVYRVMEPISSKRVRYIFVVALALIMILYALRIVERNKEWREPFLLYKRDLEREPNSFLLHCNLGVEYFRRGMMEEAKKEFHASNDVCPGKGYDVAYNNLGVIYAKEGKIQDAIACYKTSIALNNYALAYANLGSLCNILKMYKDIILILQEGTKLYPLDIEIKYQLGIAYYGNGQKELAMRAFEEIEGMQPGYSQTRTFLDLQGN